MHFKSFFVCAVLFLTGNLLFCQTVEAEPYVEKFKSNFSFRVLLSYNFMRYSEDEVDQAVFFSNRPVGIGLGFSWKKLSFKFSLTIPHIYNRNFLKTASTDFQMQYFADKFLVDGFFKNYRGLRPSSDFAGNEEIDLKLMLSGITGQYIFNAEKHSLRAAYNLTERQLKPAGSFLLGGSIFFASPFSVDNAIEKYAKRRYFLLVGPNAGYSYSWGFSNGLFLNLMITLGLNAGFELETSRVFFSPSISPAFAFGYHAKTWSLSFSGAGLMIPLKTSVKINDTIMTGKAILTFVVRF